MIDETIKAYIAGILDGEGTIIIRTIKKENRATQHHLVISIVNTSLEMLQYINKYFGGALNKRKQRLNNKTIYTLAFSSSPGYKLLNNIYRYLIIKKDQACIAMKFQEEIYNRKRNSLDIYTINKRQEYKELISNLNNKKTNVTMLKHIKILNRENPLFE